MASLRQFARSERLEASQITGVGGFERATVGWFDRTARQFRHIPVDEPCEVLSLIGDVAEDQDGPGLKSTWSSACPMGRRAAGTSSRARCSRRWSSSWPSTRRGCAVMHADLGVALIDLGRSQT